MMTGFVAEGAVAESDSLRYSASRLTVRSEPNAVLVAPAVAEALARHPDFDLTALEPADIRGFGPTTPVLLRNKVS